MPSLCQVRADTNLVIEKFYFSIFPPSSVPILFGKCSKYRSRKRLYELEKQLGKQFMQISKSTLVNLSYLDSIEAGFNGTLLLKLKNGCKDYVSRKYLPEFKKYLGL